MWELITSTIERMATDRLWIYTGIAGSICGAIFVAYFRNTRAGIWLYNKADNALTYLIDRWGLSWFKSDPDAWRKKYPHVTAKIDELEARLEALEKQQ